MNVLDTRDELLEIPTGKFFFEPLMLHDKIKELSTFDMLHN